MFTDILGWNHLRDKIIERDRQKEAEELDKTLEFETVVKEEIEEDK